MYNIYICIHIYIYIYIHINAVYYNRAYSRYTTTHHHMIYQVRKLAPCLPARASSGGTASLDVEINIGVDALYTMLYYNVLDHTITKLW